MKNDVRTDYVLRDSVMKLLSDDEVGSVSTAEAAVSLAAGEEYLDMQNLDGGVRHAPEGATPMGHVLPRKAVRAETWTRILTELAAPRGLLPATGA